WRPTDGETQDETHSLGGDAERRKPAAGLRRLARRRRPGPPDGAAARGPGDQRGLDPAQLADRLLHRGVRTAWQRPRPLRRRAARQPGARPAPEAGEGLYSALPGNLPPILPALPDCAIADFAIRIGAALCVHGALPAARMAGRRLFPPTVSRAAVDAIHRNRADGRSAQARLLRDRGAEEPLVGSRAEAADRQPALRARRPEPGQGRRAATGPGGRAGHDPRGDGARPLRL